MSTQQIRARPGANLIVDAPVIQLGLGNTKRVNIGLDTSTIVLDTDEFELESAGNVHLEIDSIQYINSPSSTLSHIGTKIETTFQPANYIQRFGTVEAINGASALYYQQFGNVVFLNGRADCSRPAGANDIDEFSIRIPLLTTLGGIKEDTIGSIARISGKLGNRQLILVAGPSLPDNDALYVRETIGDISATFPLTVRAEDMNEVVNLAFYYSIRVRV